MLVAGKGEFDPQAAERRERERKRGRERQRERERERELFTHGKLTNVCLLLVTPDGSTNAPSRCHNKVHGNSINAIQQHALNSKCSVSERNSPNLHDGRGCCLHF